MSKLTTEQIESAKKLLTELNKNNPAEKQVFLVEGSKHVYSQIENAKAQAGSKEVYRLGLTGDPELVDGKKSDKQVPMKSTTPDASWKLDELKAYATEKGIALDATDKSKDSVLAKIAAAAEPAK